MVDVIIKDVIPRAVSQGGFGRNAKLISCGLQEESDTGAQYASSLLFLKVKLEDRILPVVVKVEPENEQHRHQFNTDLQFQNEELFYSKLVPFLRGLKPDFKPTFPEFYYGSSGPEPTCGFRVIVLEDLKDKEYKSYTENVFLDFDHCVAGLKSLASFHALSYIAKQSDPIKFYALLDDLKEATWRKENILNNFSFLYPAMEKGVKPIIEKGQNIERLETFLERCRDPFMFGKTLVTPEEPIAVLCHGDFCANNVMFKYGEDGKPIDVAFIDFQSCRYSTPVVDLSFFLYLNTDGDMRTKHWDEFLKIYHNELVRVASDVRVPSFDQLLGEFSMKAAYGYIHCSFFLPVMVSNEAFDMDLFVSLEKEASNKYLIEAGGDEGTAYVTNIVQHMLDNNYI